MQYRRVHGFTLIEVLIAMAITAFVALVAYTSLSTVMTGVERTREEADKVSEVVRAMSVLSRDIRQIVDRSVLDEFGGRLSALEGGPLARETLAFTRAGWHNTIDMPRSALQRVAYYLDGTDLIRAAYPVLDRSGPIEPREATLLQGVTAFDVRFLASIEMARANRDLSIDRRQWQDNWMADVSQPGALIEPPVAIEIRMTLENWGEVERLYVLSPL